MHFSLRVVISYVSIFSTCFFLAACSHQDSLQKFNLLYYQTIDESKAYNYAKSKAKEGDVLWNLQAGISAFHIAKEDTQEILQQGEDLFSQYESQGLLGGLFGNVGAVIVNENVKTYRGNIYEGVSYNYYKALNAMSSGDYALARVEFNRANDRQRRAKDYFHKDITQAMNAALEENAQNEELRQFDTRHSEETIKPMLESQYSNLKNFHAYQGFINPAVSYVSALFFMTQGDYSKAIDLYKEAYGISKAQIITQDLDIITKRKNGDRAYYTWFLIEDGRSAALKESSINLPAYLVSERVLHVGVSIPTIYEGMPSANLYRAVSIDSTHNFSAFEVSDIDLVIANEFSKKLPFILTRAISSAMLKASTQAILHRIGEDQYGAAGALVGSLIGAAYSASTNSADVRISTALPKRILALRIPNNLGKFELQADGHTLYGIHYYCNEQGAERGQATRRPDLASNIITLCDKHDNILYLRLRGAIPSYRILKGGIE